MLPCKTTLDKTESQMAIEMEDDGNSQCKNVATEMVGTNFWGKSEMDCDTILKEKVWKQLFQFNFNGDGCHGRSWFDGNNDISCVAFRDRSTDNVDGA